MAKILCKSIRKDGSPCQGHGLKQFDGYCIAHGPADKVREWRSRGGKNSSTAASSTNASPNDCKASSMISLRDLPRSAMGRSAQPPTPQCAVAPKQ